MPLDLAILSCIPLNASAWCERTKNYPSGDFVRFISESYFNNDIEKSWAAFSTEANFIQKKLTQWKSKGLYVVSQASAADIELAANRYRNIIIFSHWKSTKLLKTDPPAAQGNRLETWDKMLSSNELAELFSKDFDGALYLASCNSNIPIEAFRRHSPRAICICNRDQVYAGLAMLKLDAAMSIMIAEGIPLWQGLLRAAEFIDSIAKRT